MYTMLVLLACSLLMFVTSATAATATVITDDTILLTNMPAGWEGACEPMGSAPHCLVWRDTPTARLVFTQDFRGTPYNPGGNWVGIGLVGMGNGDDFTTPIPVNVVVRSRDGVQHPRVMYDVTHGVEAMIFENEVSQATQLLLGLGGPLSRTLVAVPGGGTRLAWSPSQLTAFPLDGVQLALQRLNFHVRWWLAHQPPPTRAQRPRR